MSDRDLFDRLRELVPSLYTVEDACHVDTYGAAVLGPNSLRAIITALTPCDCGAVAGQDCAPDCDPDCDMNDYPPAHNIAGSPYISREFRRDADGRWMDPSGAYGYATRLAGNWVCYTCGHLCECGDSE
jgi:hypothetical protein